MTLKTNDAVPAEVTGEKILLISGERLVAKMQPAR
jgi:hypothetical protein